MCTELKKKKPKKSVYLRSPHPTMYPDRLETLSANGV